ncbi:XisI protein [Chloroflexi bacterium TSY]|nr:XisI protein [Chloroflexi bacterium TSY]
MLLERKYLDEPPCLFYSPTLYVRIRNGKFWIEEDWTEEGIATHLVEAGVPKSDIVLGFHAPNMRPHTEFAVA